MLWVLCGTHVPQAVGLARVKTRPWIGPCLTFLHCVISNVQRQLESGKEEGENQALDRPRLLSGRLAATIYGHINILHTQPAIMPLK